MIRWIVTATLVVAATAFCQTPRQLSLDEAIRIGKANNRILAISSEKVRAASARLDEAGAGLLPSLKIAGGYARYSDVPPFQFQLPNAPAPITLAPTVLNSYNARVSIQQPLFTGFKLLSNARVAESLLRASQADNRNDTEDIVLNITSAFWFLYQAQEIKKLVDENVSRLGMYRKDTENLLNAGMATRNDLLRIDVQVSTAMLTQIDAANDAKVAMMNLNNMVGLPVETAIQLTSTPGDTISMGMGGSAGNLTEQAFTFRQDLLAMQSRIEAARSGVAAARGNYFPQIYLTGNYYYNRPNARYQPTLDEFKPSWDVGVQFQFDVWNWGAISSQVEQARAALSQSQIQYEQMKENVVLEVKRNNLAVLRAKEKIGVARTGVDQAEENLRMTRDKYKNGLATSTELLDADVALLQAKTNHSIALVEQEIAVARLRKSLGGQY